MWEPRRLTTLWAFTACYRIALPLIFFALVLVGFYGIWDWAFPEGISFWAVYSYFKIRLHPVS
jgi:hypothetical protein